MNAEKLTYNLTGQGLLTTLIYPHTKALYHFLKKYHYDAKFHFTNQLGALRNFLHGAHHTRYEYIILQWVLINHLKDKVKGLGLSRNRDIFGSLPGITKSPSGGEILQCLSILTNMGHFPDTFAASRAWLYLLKMNQGKVATAFKSGLHTDDKTLLDNYVKNFDIYHIHLINALFLLERYRRAEQGNKYVDFSRRILSSYITRKDKELTKLWEIYGQIRQLSYLILDSHYAPIPFVLDLSSILLNFDQVSDQILNQSSEFQKGVRQLDRVLQDTLYMTGNSLITTSARTEEIIKDFSNLGHSVNWKKISVVRDLLEPLTVDANEISSVFQKCSFIDFPIPDWDSTKILEQKYSFTRRQREASMNDVVKWETCTRQKIGTISCRIAAQYYPVPSKLKTVFALLKRLPPEKCFLKSLDCAKEAMEFNCQIKKEAYQNRFQYENDEKLLLFLLKSTFGWETNYKLEFPEWKGIVHTGVDTRPLFAGKGSICIAKRLAQYIEHMKDEFEIDQLHEYSLVERVLRLIGYRGQVLAFAGSTKIRQSLDKATEDAEFDGIIFLPGKREEVFLIIIEAKNQPHGQTSARGQLRRRLGDLLPSYLEFELVNLDRDGAYAMVKARS